MEVQFRVRALSYPLRLPSPQRQSHPQRQQSSVSSMMADEYLQHPVGQ